MPLPFQPALQELMTMWAHSEHVRCLLYDIYRAIEDAGRMIVPVADEPVDWELFTS